jgi:hypothetical protein
MTKLSESPTVRNAKISDLIPDANNSNDGTERGAFMLRQSVEQAGVGRGIVVDRHLNIIGGNKTHATVGELGLDNIVLVDTSGETLIVAVRTDLDLSAAPGTPEHDKARTLALADNRTGEVSLSWNPEVLSGYAEAGGVELGDWFRTEELTGLFETAQTGDWQATQTSAEAVVADETQLPPAGMKIPLAIALTSRELKAWNTLKEQQNVISDTAAIVKILEEKELL